MSGRTQTALIKKGRVLVLWLLVFVSYFFSLKAYMSIVPSYGAPVFLADNWPDGVQAAEILKKEKEKEEPARLCFYYDGGLMTLYEKEYGRQTKVLAAGIQGDSSLYDWRMNSLDENDADGCIVDQKTARELFGSTSVIGREIILGEDSYQVRDVLPLKERIMLYHPKDRDAAYTKVFVGYKEGESIENTVSQFLMSYGLSGTAVEGEILENGALLGLCLVPGLMFLAFFVSAGKEEKRCKEKKIDAWIWKGIRILLLAVLAWVLYKNIHIPAEWLPGKWSDFSFYPARLQEELVKLRLYLVLSRTVVQAENLILTGKSIFLSVTSFFLCMGLLLFNWRREGIAQTQRRETF